MNDLINELVIKTIDTLRLPDIEAKDIDPEAPLIGGDLGIDSIDVLELVIMLEKDYGVKIENKQAGKEAFASFSALAAFVSKHNNS